MALNLRNPALVPIVAGLLLAVGIIVAVIAYQGQTHPTRRVTTPTASSL